MLMNIAGFGVILAILGLALMLSGHRRKDVESASVGGTLVGTGIMVLAVQFFYIFQLEDEGGGYHGTLASEALLVAFLMAGLALVVISLYGWARHTFFWRFFVRPHRM